MKKIEKQEALMTQEKQDQLQEITDFQGKKRAIKRNTLDRCIYPNLRQWMIVNRIPMIELSKICGLSKTTHCVIRSKLLGEVDFRISEIKAILGKSGRTFEYMFKENESQENRINIPRNIEMADAIGKCLKKYYNSENSTYDKSILEFVRGWAWEIILNCNAELENYKEADI